MIGTMTERLAALKAAALAVIHEPPTDDELADTVGAMREMEVLLADTRRRWERIAYELPPVESKTRGEPPTVRGREYELVPQYKIERSFNTPAILVAIQRVTEWDAWQVLLEARRADAVRWTWRWTDLNKFLSRLNVPLHKAYVEVTDDDGTAAPMVGEVRKEAGVKRVPIDPKPDLEVEPLPEPPPDDDGEG
jgi:hypothetical protein